MVREDVDQYALFRVEWLEPGSTCVISWAVVPSTRPRPPTPATSARFKPLRPAPVKALTFAGKRVNLLPDGTWKAVIDSPWYPRWRELGELRTATLLSRAKYREYEKATFSFVQGVRGDGDVRTYNRHQLLYGNGVNPADMLDVSSGQDSRGTIRDLGSMSWAEFREVPRLIPHLEPAHEPAVRAVVGHIYVTHVKDANTDLYAVFRVEGLKSGDSCTFSWIIVPSPEIPAELSLRSSVTYSGQPVFLDADGTWKPNVESVDGREWRTFGKLQTMRLFSIRKYFDFDKGHLTFQNTWNDPYWKVDGNLVLLFGSADEDSFDFPSHKVDRRIRTWVHLTGLRLERSRHCQHRPLQVAEFVCGQR